MASWGGGLVSWRSTGWKIIAVAVGTYAVVKITRKRASEIMPVMPRGYSGGLHGGVGGGQVVGHSLKTVAVVGAVALLGTYAVYEMFVMLFAPKRAKEEEKEPPAPRIYSGGSLGEVGGWIARKDLSDVDLVAFVNEPYLKPIAEIGKAEYKRTLSRIISKIKSSLQNEPNVKIIRSDDYLVNFKIKVGRRWIDVDLLPTAKNALSFQTSYRDLFLSMLDVGHDTRQFYSAAFVQHQVQFVKEQPGYVKELIRLVKYWASKFLPKSLQKSYPLELITIYLWEKQGKPGRRLSKAQGLKSVLKVLTNLDRLRVSWQDVDFDETIITRLGMQRPIVLDPANPTNNVCYMYQWGDNKEVIRTAAKRTLRTALLRNVPAWP